MTLQNWQRVYRFLYDLTDPDMFGLSLRDPEIRRRAMELLELFK